jgi:glycosyl-4,4'-diaponeurosporenoate acyltransferase
MARLAIETRRAELVHWALMACGPLFFFWNPPALGSAMLLFAVAANGPCIVIQRFNRLRLLRLIARATKVRA